MQKISIDQAIEEILRNDTRYHHDAYEFIREALDFTIKQHKKSNAGKERHINGKELLEGVRLYALDQYGPLACTVLQSWNICRCEDVGEIVFNMVDMSILKTTETDSREDFKKGFDFKEAFRRPFEPSSSTVRKVASRLAKVSSIKPAP